MVSDSQKTVLKEVALFGQSFSGTHDNPRIVCKPLEFHWSGLTMMDEIKELDRLFLEIMQSIKDEYPSNTVFSLGLSGGWDSRLLLHYALQAGIKPRLFFMGSWNYHGRPWKNRSYLSSCQIARLYHLEKPVIIPFLHVPIKNFYDGFCRENPLMGHGIYRDHVHKQRYLSFDVEISGFRGGEPFGDCFPRSLSTQGFPWYALTKWSGLHSVDPLEGVVTDEEITWIFRELLGFAHHFKDPRLASHSFLLNVLQRLDYKEKYRVMPFMHPLFMEHYRSWNVDWLIDGILQKEFFRVVLPRLSRIPCQRENPPFSYRDPSTLQKTWYKYMRLARGSYADYHRILGSPGFHQFAHAILTKPPCNGFNELFDVNRVLRLPSRYWSNGGIAPNIVRIKNCWDMGLYQGDTLE